MKSNYDSAFHLLLELEGYYSNDADDTGGETMYGITKNNFPQEYAYISSLKTKQEKLTFAKNFYLKNFWTALDCDNLPDKYDIVAFQLGVNTGASRAKRMIELTTDWKDLLFYQLKFYAEIGKGTNLKFLRGWVLRVIRTFEFLKSDTVKKKAWQRTE